MSSEAPTERISLPPGAFDDPPPRRRRRRWVAAAAGLLLLAAGVVVALRWPDRAAGEQAPQAGPAVETAELERQDLSTTDSLTGTLGYGAARPVTGGGRGVVTWLPKPGVKVTRGHQLYRVDDRPVQLFYGSLPLYRPLSARNTVGRDVRIVANNLRALGYSMGHQPSPGDWVAVPQPPGKGKPGAEPAHRPSVRVRSGESVLTASLIAAIKRWQRDARMPETGTIAPGDVVVQRGPVRVDSVAVQPGAAADGPLLSVTPTGKVISVLADAAEAGAVDRGDKVTVSLPGEQTAKGTVSAVGTELKAQEGDGGDGPPRLSITVTLDDPKKAKRIDSADVEVAFAGETHEDVLVAPVGALVALSEGGYAVQVAGGGLVAVETGMFARGLVEIEGAGLGPGTQVVTTS
ncbi:HlyD family efflux transporter periplasmic adaptor subunit [Couchioplanes caeruleus]|uniref:HlyD family efflux transporter periplasmic adaptor subunit n=1 Tax=Couchioplanes caeruleus TaxID=56438 RepID=UPI0020BDE9FD|nr:HlyD family efflux transporter periplasmic adaptor subunit [Couchioplanes caeruleus]UQU62438.1 HlyD family efflux transporter periplasmic adaptor subunit [Couchioplanes caeruleus]